MNEQMLKMLCNMAGIDPAAAAAKVQEIGVFVQGLSGMLADIKTNQQTIIDQNNSILEQLAAQKAIPHDNNSSRAGKRKLNGGGNPASAD